MLFLLCHRALRNSERCIEYVNVPAVLWLQAARPLSRARAHPAFRTSAGGSLVSKRRLDPCCAPFSSMHSQRGCHCLGEFSLAGE